MGASAFLELLREATKGPHEAVEAELNLFGTAYTLERYVALLARFHCLHAVLEPHLQAELERMSFALPYSARQRLDRLEVDLSYFSVFPLQSDRCAVEWLRQELLPNGTAAVGLLYVLEGSALGGSTIAKYFQKHLGIGPLTGGAFFHGDGLETIRSRWADVSAALDAYALRLPEAIPEVVQGAMHAFSLFSKGFRSSMPGKRAS